jgi:hypothetical protein
VRLELATRWVLRELAARGVYPASLRVTRLDPRGMALRDVAFGEELAAREIEVDLDVRAQASRVRRVRIAGLDLRLDLRPGAPLLGPLDAPLRLALAGVAGDPGTATPPALDIADAAIVLEMEQKELAVELSLRLDEPDPDGASSGRLELAARPAELGGFAIAGASLELPFRLTSSESAFSVSWSQLARAEVALAAGPIQLSSERGRLDVKLGDAPELVPDADLVVSLPELDLAAAHVPASRWRVALKDGSLEAEGAALGERVRARLSATLDPALAKLALGPVEFAPGRLQPVELDPRLAALQEVRGRISAAAELRWSGGELRRSNGSVTLSALSFRSSAATIDGLGGVVQLTSLSPLASPPAQTLSAAALQVAGIRFERPALRFALTPDGARLEEAHASLGSGTVWVNDVRLSPADPERELVLRAADLELGELLALAPLEGVAGTGRISGTLPVHVGRDALEIRGGVFEAIGPGRLQIHSDRIRSALGSAGATVEQLVSALEDFHYDQLRLELEKPARGESSARLRLLGRNPAVLEGRDFALNINLETDLEPLLKAIGTGLRLTGEWTRPVR